MNEANQILNKLPPYQGDQRLVTRRQDTFDIIRELLKKHGETTAHYNSIAKDQWKGNVRDTAKHLYLFLKHNVPYQVEPTLKQTVKTPAAILEERNTWGNDCKHYASYCIGVGAALRRMGYPITCFYRFASYHPTKRSPGHVFAVFVDHGNEIWVDPVPEIKGFDSRAIMPNYIIDKTPPMGNRIGTLYDISGLDNRGMVSGTHGGGGWLDHYYGHGNYLGKAKKKGLHIKIKAPHIKIKPGKLLSKVALAPARGAFLLLAKINMFNLAVAMHKHLKDFTKLANEWKKLGGNVNSLKKNIAEGVKEHNRLHPHAQVKGLDDEDNYYEYGGHMGIAPVVAAPAILAAAAPILLALNNILKSFGVDTKNAKAATDDGTAKVAKKHNKHAKDTDDAGDTTHDDGTVTQATDNADGSQTVHIKHVPGAKEADEGTDGDDDEGGAAVTKTKAKKVSKDGDGDDDDDDNGDGAASGGSFSAMLSNVTGFVSEHKWAFIGGTGAVLATVIIFKILHHKKPGRRK